MMNHDSARTAALRGELAAATRGGPPATSPPPSWNNQVARMERYQRADNDRASRRLVFAAAISGGLFAVMFLAFCVAGRLPRFPWQAFCSLTGIATLIAAQLWKMCSAA